VGRWTIVRHLGGNNGYECRCECGVVAPIQTGRLRIGWSKQCRQCSTAARYAASRPKVGERYGSWTVKGVAAAKVGRCLAYECVCVCGGAGIHRGSDLVKGLTKKCLACSGGKNPPIRATRAKAAGSIKPAAELRKTK
jgi:hypothetical protein